MWEVDELQRGDPIDCYRGLLAFESIEGYAHAGTQVKTRLFLSDKPDTPEAKLVRSLFIGSDHQNVFRRRLFSAPKGWHVLGVSGIRHLSSSGKSPAFTST